ncbi:MAG: hypothetical protein ACR2PH_17750 [Desulfobulbia bacterium]
MNAYKAGTEYFSSADKAVRSAIQQLDICGEYTTDQILAAVKCAQRRRFVHIQGMFDLNKEMTVEKIEIS